MAGIGGGLVEDAVGDGAGGWLDKRGRGDGVVASAHWGEHGEKCVEGEVDVRVGFEDIEDAGTFGEDFGVEVCARERSQG